MNIRDATIDDVPGIMLIYNDAVQNTTAIWNDTLVDEENRRAWLMDRQGQGYPVLVVVDDSGAVFGYASFGDWRAFDGYRYTVEHSVYVRRDRRGAGLGQLLMIALIERARKLNKHVMVAAIEAANQKSIALHTKLGFIQTGLMPEVGTKFGRWLDLAYMQLKLGDEVPN